jgi:DNA-binding MarR family transcriptional regulator
VQSSAAALTDASQDAVVDSVLSASRALVAVAARSLAAAEEQVTLPQYRALVVLASRGPQRAVDLAEALGVSQSTGTRMCDRLERKGLISRVRPAADRRTVITTITPAGMQLVDAVTRRRRREIRAILRKMTPDVRAALVPTFRAFADAAGEAPDQAWSLGWGE